jgi:hypothetical protein
MGSFINNLIDRSTESAQSIQPRLRGKFERDITSPDFLTENDATTFDVDKTQDEQFPIRQATTVSLSLFKNVVDEPAENTRQSRVSKPLQENTPQIKDDIAPEKPPRFKPPYELLTPQNIDEDAPAERHRHILRHPNAKTSADEIHQGESRHAQIAPKNLQAPSTTLSKTRDSKEIYKSLPVVNAATDLVAPAEGAQSHIKQPGTSFRQQKTSPSGHSQTINISIGRIEVRVSQSPAQSPLKPKTEGGPIMSLDDYLRKRNQGSE